MKIPRRFFNNQKMQDAPKTTVKKQSFKSRMARLLGVSENRVVDILKASDAFTCRLNRLRKVSRNVIVERAQNQGIDLMSISWYPDAFIVKNTKFDLVNTDLVKGGVLFIQNASSYLPVLALEPKQGETILDVCAAPGGKSSHIAALTNGEIDLWLNDGIKTRLDSLKQVQKLLGFKYSHLTSFPAQSIDKEIHQQFDKILLDVQCSGEGMIDIEKPITMRFWSMDRIEKYMRLQTKALNAAFKLLKPGGTLVYSTCTFAPEENEAPINNLLKHNQDAIIQPLIFESKYVRHGEKQWDDMVFDSTLRGALRVLPHDGMEGFFVCRIRKAPIPDNNQPVDLKEIGKHYATLNEDL